MSRLELALVEFPDSTVAGPRVLGRLVDPDLIEAAQERIAARLRRELAAYEPPVRLVESDGKDGSRGR